MKKQSLISAVYIMLTMFLFSLNSAMGQSADSLVITEQGNVGIGTTTPTQKLDVSGTIKAIGLNVNGTINSADLDVSGTIKATRFEGDGSSLTGVNPWVEHGQGGGGLDTFESGFGGWTNASGDDFEWTRETGPTSSWDTGPDSAYEGIYYIYTESSSPSYPFKTAIIESADLSSTDVESIDFWYHMYGNTMGTLYLEYYDGASWNFAWSLSGDQGNSWYNAVVDLSPYDVRKLRFRGYTGNSYTSDICLDNVNIIVPVVDPSITYMGGKVGIGEENPEYTLHVNGAIGTTNTGQVHSDYVFESNYELMGLNELENYIKKEKHLPGIITDPKQAPSIDILRLNGKLLEKVEELTLHIIELNKQVLALKSKVNKLEDQK